MSQVEINGVKVNFPFEPYPVQVAYMKKVIETLESSTNAVLESPTGTGKTLSLLCSTLAWLLHKKEMVICNMKAHNKPGDISQDILKSWDIPKVYYTSRTHSQLSQAVQELKRSSYSFVKAIVLGSRDQMCIHPEVSQEQNSAQKIQLCKIHVTNRSCSFHSRLEEKKNRPEIAESPVLDIEDLVAIGRKIRMCPYFGSREISSEADIIFMPYNYLIDPNARRANNIQLRNTIIIFDEAHNVEKMCEEAASVCIKSSDIALAIEEVTFIMKMLDEGDAFLEMGGGSDEVKDFTIDDLVALKEILLKFEQAIDEVELPNKFSGTTFPGDYMFELYSKANVNYTCFSMVITLLEKLLTFLAAAQQRNLAFRKGAGLQNFAQLTAIVFDSMKDDKVEKMAKSFKVHFEVEEIRKTKGADKDGWISSKAHQGLKMAKVVNFWCFNPGFGMHYLLNSQVRSIILTSGTLAPLKPLIAELGIPISNSLENPHIIKPSQIFVKVVSNGPDREKLISNYENRDNPKYINSLGGTIANFCNVIPDGVLVFFPSYAVMNKCVSSWQASGIYSRISKRKPIFVEPQGKEAFLATMAEFYDKINNPTYSGACFFAVCRGKVSEGLDFADANGRAVLITGLPFPPFKDSRVVLKKQYLEHNRTRENELLSGNDWYFLEATRAVNQAIGRVIRHKDDYGAILLCDSRFANRSQQSQLSTWIQEHLKNANDSENNFGKIIRELKLFFDKAKCTTGLSVIDNRSSPSTSFECKSAFVNTIPKVKNENRVIIPESDIGVISDSSSQFNIHKYKSENIKKEETDFSTRLYQGDAQVINFNDQIADQMSTVVSSPSFVKIHKRDRCADLTSPENILKNLSKKKKLKIIGNDTDIDKDSNIENRNLLESKTIIKSSISEDNEKVSKTMDRLEFLKLIRSSLSSQDVNKFNRALIAYRDSDNIDIFFSILCSLFSSSVFTYLLKGTRRYIKNHHKDKFDKLLEEFLKAKCDA
ncbi:regulator of telomere elongation helicase 1 homolog [Condylostylus longicornis]|uniref:regulator of telomere elongation helicase 1 homolog n=1 Tax=Condylostylus longicornis TaxID=2530218 RepID=UPI00244E2E5B|nr:regulator of telomere elongation helicase 1 homolog [Condylostylus longicornis]